MWSVTVETKVGTVTLLGYTQDEASKEVAKLQYKYDQEGHTGHRIYMKKVKKQ